MKLRIFASATIFALGSLLTTNAQAFNPAVFLASCLDTVQQTAPLMGTIDRMGVKENVTGTAVREMCDFDLGTATDKLTINGQNGTDIDSIATDHFPDGMFQFGIGQILPFDIRFT